MKRLRIIAFTLIASLGASQAQAWNAPVWLAQAWSFVKKHPAITTAATLGIGLLTGGALVKTLINKHTAHCLRLKKQLFDNLQNTDYTIHNRPTEKEKFTQSTSFSQQDLTDQLASIHVENTELNSTGTCVYFDNLAAYKTEPFYHTQDPSQLILITDTIKQNPDELQLTQQPFPAYKFGLTTSYNETSRNFLLAMMNTNNNYSINNPQYRNDLEPFLTRDPADNNSSQKDLKKYFALENECPGITNNGWYIGKLDLAYLKSDKQWSTLTDNEVKQLKKQALQGMSMVYKLHLQIKPEYIVSFMQDFLHFIATNPYGRIIYHVKAFTKHQDNTDDDYNRMPCVVAYITLLPGTKQQRNTILQNIMQAIADRYKNLPPDAIYHHAPRFSRQVKDFIWLAQGDGNTKEILEKIQKKVQEQNKKAQTILKQIDNPYSEDLCFFKEYEYEGKIN